MVFASYIILLCIPTVVLSHSWLMILNIQMQWHNIIYNFSTESINQSPISQKDLAKYPEMHFDSRLNWKHHVRQKKNTD